MKLNVLNPTGGEGDEIKAETKSKSMHLINTEISSMNNENNHYDTIRRVSPVKLGHESPPHLILPVKNRVKTPDCGTEVKLRLNANNETLKTCGLAGRNKPSLSLKHTEKLFPLFPVKKSKMRRDMNEKRRKARDEFCDIRRYLRQIQEPDIETQISGPIKVRDLKTNTEA